MTIETINDSLVGMRGADEIVVHGSTATMSRAKALRLAAWIVAIADPLDEEFTQLLQAIRRT